MKFPPLSFRHSQTRGSGYWIAAAFAVAGSLALWCQPTLAAGGLKLLGGWGSSSSTTATGGNDLIAQSTAPVFNGPSRSGELCMQKAFGTPVTSANRLNCTANDISIARTIRVSPDRCIAGSRVDLVATFAVNVTANERYDAAFYFRTDGGANARGDGATASGQCSLSSLDRTLNPAQNLDGDTCGDLNAGPYELTFEIKDVLCEDDDGNGLLNLPNCTAWHSNAGTSCSSDPFVLSSHKPETKSKCKCDDNFNIPVRVETPGVSVDKSATPDSVSENGSQVTFTATVKNDSGTVSVAIKSLTDSSPILGPNPVDLLGISQCGAGQPSPSFIGPCTPANATTACPSLNNLQLAAGASASCQFALFIKGNAGATIPDTVRACVTSLANGEEACGTAVEEVVVTDVSVDPTLQKTASGALCQVDVTYMVAVTNNSDLDSLTVNSLTDDKFGSITAPHSAIGSIGEVVSTTCGNAAGSVVAVGESYNCSFVGRIQSSNCSVDHQNTVTGSATDDDGVNFGADKLVDSARVRVNSQLTD